MSLLLLLAACDAPAPGPTAKDTDTAGVPDTATDDTAETGPDDTAETGPDDSAETGEPATSDGAHAWTGTFFAAPDLRIKSCGSSEGELVVVEGPDLDGDGLPEVAVGAPDADGDAYGQGRVYVLRGSDIATGRVDLFAPLATVTLVGAAPRTGFGGSLRWYDDLDGDGLGDLFVYGDAAYHFVSGADLLAGGDIAPTTASFFGAWDYPRRWDDVDGDGRDDWILADDSREWSMAEDGVVYVALDADLGPTGITAPFAYVTGGEESRFMGKAAAPLSVDLDGDGIRELLVSDHTDVALLSSAAILAGETSALVAELARIPGMGRTYEMAVLGDVDGGGVEEIAFFQSGSLCVVRGEALTGGTLEATCDATGGAPDHLAAAGDVDGDGDLDVWVAAGATVSAVDATDLVDGTWTVVRALPPLGEDVAQIVTVDGGVWLGAGTSGWAPRDAIWRYDDDGALAATVVGGGWGGEPGEPYRRDVDHDGLEDLVFAPSTDARFVVTGVQLAAGGEIALCDAAYAFTFDADHAWFADDVDGDGMDEVVLTTTGDVTRTHRVMDGAALLTGGGEVEVHRFEAGYMGNELTACRMLADGSAPLVAREDGAIVLYAPGLVGGLDADAARIGTIDARSPAGCAPDLDGDGVDELLVPWAESDAFAVIPASALAPDTVVDSYSAALVLFRGEDDGLETAFAGTLGTESVWGFLGGGRGMRWFTLPATPVTSDEDLGAYATVSGDYHQMDAAWLDHAVGGDEPDLVVHSDDGAWNAGFYGIDGMDLSERVLLAPTVPHVNDLIDWEAGQGPDVLGTGASSFWLLVRQDATMRGELEFVYARRPE